MFKRNKPAPAAIHTPRSRKALEGDNPLARRLKAEDEPATIDLESGDGFGNGDELSPVEPPTRQLGEQELPSHRQAEDSRAVPETAPCGILVVLSGPARGDILTLHYGENRVFRNDSGDFSVTREAQTGAEQLAEIHFDPDTQSFELFPGVPGHPVSINDDELVTARTLIDGQHIGCGSVEFRLVAICNERFSW